LDYNKHCSAPQFSYVQAYEETNPKNSQLARTLDCIYLRPADTIQGGHVLFHLATQATVKRQTIKIIPITNSVIEAVERLAKADNMAGLVLHNKNGTKFYDSSWLSGVDYHQNTQEDDYDDIYQDPDYEVESESDIKLYADEDYYEDELQIDDDYDEVELEDDDYYERGTATKTPNYKKIK
jgi:hypothetical protein